MRPRSRLGAIAATAAAVLLAGGSTAQEHPAGHQHGPAAPVVALQPLAQQARAIAATLAYLGPPLPPADLRRIDEAMAQADERTAVERLQQVLDGHVLAVVDINPESRVKVAPGGARAELVEGGTRLFLVKVLNQAGVTAPLAVESPNSGAVSVRSSGSPDPPQTVTRQDVMERWADISIYRTEVNVYSKPPMGGRLSGFPVDYQILQVYSRDRGQRKAVLRFNVGQGSQDLGFRNETTVLFNALPAHPVRLRIQDEHGRPAMASVLIRDRLKRIHPSASKRLAPDFPFQPHVYRMDGDTLLLPSGTYTVTCGRGPEYHPQVQELVVDGPEDLSCRPARWIDPSKHAWYSGDHHIHAAGCAHYENPERGVGPKEMLAQVQGEALNVGAVLTWGPCYYHQKQFFSGADHPLSTREHLLHYDLEVSGFPSSHAGHLVLLGLKEQDYPGATRIEQWPTWDLPVLKWAKEQGAVTGFAHSGWGLGVSTGEVPSYEMPGFDSIGANEYIVDVTHDAVDFISAADTPPSWELSIWYHTLNVGFRTRISGETDFPCITHDRVGQGRSYAKVDGPLTYGAWIDAVRKGRTYVGDGRSHLMDFTVNGREAGTEEGEIRLAAGDLARVTVKVAAYLDPVPNEAIRGRPYDQAPYWDVERARLGPSREVPVELVVGGRVAARKAVVADGTVRDVSFEVPLRQSSWLAVRIMPSAHTNPVFAIVDGKPIRASRRSAEWCLAAVNQCWTQKAPKIAPGELEEARRAYNHARAVYRRLIAESPADR
jgi:hypothetical protein